MLCRACHRAALTRPASALSSRTTLPKTAAATLTTCAAPRAQQTTQSFRAAGATKTISPKPVFPAVARSSYSTQPASSSSPALEKPDFLDEAESWIWDKLASEFDPVDMSVRDVSGGCGSMYAIDITSDKFRGANMLKQQRMVNSVLGDKVKEWHGLQLRTKTP